jgi:gas vesicle protein
VDSNNIGLLDGISERLALLPTDFVFVSVVLYLFWEFKNYLKADDEQALEHGPAELTTIGVIGTFIGISIGLAGFDVNDINGSVPVLLQGLKTAFLTSVLGIGAGLYIKRKKLKLIDASEKEDDFTPQTFKAMFDNHLESQSSLIASMERVADELSGNKDDSVSSVLSKIRNDVNDNHKQSREDMKDFVKELAEQSTKGIIETLEEVIRDFNNKIGEQFGENFAKLEIAVGHLNEWQQQNKKQVAILIESFDTAASNQERVAESIALVEESTSVIPDHMKQLSAVLKANEDQLTALTKNLGAFAKMREKAEESIPVIDQHIEQSVKTMKEAVERASGHYQTLLNDSRSMIDNFNKASQEFSSATKDGSQLIRSSLDGVARDVKESGENMHQSVMKSANTMKLDMETVGESLKQNVNKQVSDIFEQFTKTEHKLKNLLSENWNQWDEAMQKEVARVIGLMAGQLTQVSGAFVNDYQRMLQQINGSMQQTAKILDSVDS